MRRTIEVPWLLQGMITLCLLAGRVSGAVIHIPEWSEGMTWTIEHEPTQLPNRQFSPVLPRPADSAAAEAAEGARNFWTFTVEKVVEQGRTRLYSVLVRPRDATKTTEADLVFAGELDDAGLQVKLFLLKGVYRYPSKGSLSELRRDYNEMSSEPFPVVGGGNPIPLDFPCLYQVGRDKDDDTDGVWKEFTFYKPLLGEVYVHTVRQTILLDTQKIRRSERYKVLLERKENQDVYLRLKPDNVVSRLVFNPQYPWPVFGESLKGRFWLVPDKKSP